MSSDAGEKAPGKRAATGASAFARAGLTSILVMALGVITGVLVARVLGAENRGYLAAIVFWPQLLSTVLRIPFSNVIVVLKDRGHDVEALARQALRIAMIGIVISIPVIVLAALFLVGDTGGDHALLTSVFAVVLVFCSQQTQVFEGVLRATGRFDLVNALRISVPLGYLVFGAVFALLGLDLAGFVIAHVLAMIFSYGFRLFLRRGSGSGGAEDAPSTRVLLQSAASFYGVSISVYLTSNVDRMLVLLAATPAMVGQYFVAMTVAQPVNSIVITMLQSVGLPQLVQMTGQRQVMAFGRLMRATVLLSGASAIVVAILAPFVVPVVFGAEFAPAGVLAAQLSLALLLGPVRHAAGQLLMAIGQQRVVTLSNIVFVALFSLSFLSGQVVGVGPAAAIGFLVGNAAALAMVMVAIRKHDPVMASWATLLPRGADVRELSGILSHAARRFSAAFGRRRK